MKSTAGICWRSELSYRLTCLLLIVILQHLQVFCHTASAQTVGYLVFHQDLYTYWGIEYEYPEYFGEGGVPLGGQLVYIDEYDLFYKYTNLGFFANLVQASENDLTGSYQELSEEQFYSILSSNVYCFPDKNYITAYTPLIGVTSSLDLLLLGAEYRRTDIQYYDDLGRPDQYVAVAASPDYKDIIKPIVYDQYGREASQYLPFAVSGTNDGAWVENAVLDQGQYYDNLFSGDTARSEAVFDNSPLNRVMIQGAPGTVWQPDGHPLRYDYGTNAADVMFWVVNSNNSLIRDGYYDQGTLYKTTVKDENWISGFLHTSEEYKNFKGQVVLKRNYVVNSASNIIPVETYYVYDDFNLLRFVLPPEAINHLGTTTVFTQDSSLIKAWCYYYKYDNRKRMTIKQLPGAAPVYMVYDKRDRIVVTQDGNTRQDSSWFFTKYDTLNRPVLTGVLKTTSTLTLAQMQDSVDNAYSDSTPRPYCVIRDDQTTTHLGYTNTSFPNTIDGSDITYYTATYYDDYDYLDSKDFESDLAVGNTTHLEEVKGLVTGTKALVLDGGSTYLTATTYYNEKYRPIQVLRDLYDLNEMVEITSNSYDFIGQLVETKTSHVTETDTTEVIKYYSYDHMGRLLRIRQEANDTTLVLSEMGYNDLGQLDEKKLHVSGSTALQTINYEYNIRGWLTSINDPTDLGNDLFSMELCYDNSSIVTGLTTQAQYNGNISGLRWKSTGDSNIKGYGYSYDALNRLTSSDYGEGSSFATNQNMFNESIGGYDLNGNIKSLDRIGLDGTTQLTLDSLTYVYSGNQLQRIIDAASTSLGFIDTTNTFDYDYDLNGNLTQDLNKGIGNIDYNYLNLPKEVTKDANNNIVYIYDAMGMKLKRISTVDGTPTERYYAGAFEYDDEEDLDLIHNEEGVVNVSGSTYTYEYFLKDHLGNTRVTFKPNGSSLTSLQKVEYYPFGMVAVKTDGESDNKYLYNGKELQEVINLELYDYGARFYDAQIGRFTTVDPLAEWHFNYTPYHYTFNNPINFFDLLGLDTLPPGPVPGEGMVYLDEVVVTAERTTESSPNYRVINWGFGLKGDFKGGDNYWIAKNTFNISLDIMQLLFNKFYSLKFRPNRKAVVEDEEGAYEEIGLNTKTDKEIMSETAVTSEPSTNSGEPVKKMIERTRKNIGIPAEYRYYSIIQINDREDSVTIAEEGTGKRYGPKDTISIENWKEPVSFYGQPIMINRIFK